MSYFPPSRERLPWGRSADSGSCTAGQARLPRPRTAGLSEGRAVLGVPLKTTRLVTPLGGQTLTSRVWCNSDGEWPSHLAVFRGTAETTMTPFTNIRAQKEFPAIGISRTLSSRPSCPPALLPSLTYKGEIALFLHAFQASSTHWITLEQKSFSDRSRSFAQNHIYSLPTLLTSAIAILSAPTFLPV